MAVTHISLSPRGNPAGAPQPQSARALRCSFLCKETSLVPRLVPRARSGLLSLGATDLLDRIFPFHYRTPSGTPGLCLLRPNSVPHHHQV